MENNEEKPLTLNQLVEYNQTVLFPAMEERFLTKKEFNSFNIDITEKFAKITEEFSGFKNEVLNNEDDIIKKLDILLDEKEVREYQETKHKKLWAIMIRALKEHQILSPKELEEINSLEIF